MPKAEVPTDSKFLSRQTGTSSLRSPLLAHLSILEFFPDVRPTAGNAMIHNPTCKHIFLISMCYGQCWVCSPPVQSRVVKDGKRPDFYMAVVSIGHNWAHKAASSGHLIHIGRSILPANGRFALGQDQQSRGRCPGR